MAGPRVVTKIRATTSSLVPAECVCPWPLLRVPHCCSQDWTGLPLQLVWKREESGGGGTTQFLLPVEVRVARATKGWMVRDPRPYEQLEVTRAGETVRKGMEAEKGRGA